MNDLTRQKDGQQVGRTELAHTDAAGNVGVGSGDNPYPVTIGSGSMLDRAGRFRVSAPFPIFDNKNTSSRHETLFNERLIGQVLEHGAVTSGPYVVSNTVTNGTVTGTITAVNAGSITVNVDNSNFAIGDTLTSGATTSTATSVDTGSYISHLSNEAAVRIQIGSGATDRAVRQTTRYFAYIPGKSQRPIMTSVLTSKENVITEYGYFDDSNGTFFRNSNGVLSFVIRSSTSGSPSDAQEYPQSTWNKDVLDGTGNALTNPSGIDISAIAKQVLDMSILWLGADGVTFGFKIGDNLVIAHQQNFSNEGDTVFMATPTLPMRYEIRNTGATASATAMKEICCSVNSEGGYTLPGLEFSCGHLITAPRSVTARTPVFAIRLLNSFNGMDNRKTSQLLSADFGVATNDALFEIVHVHGLTSITANWIPIDGTSAVEYSRDISALTALHQHVMKRKEVDTSAANKSQSFGIALNVINNHGFISQSMDSDNSELFVVYATPKTGTSLVSVTLDQIEFD